MPPHASDVLEPLEGRLDPPAAVIERPVLFARIAPGVEQVGHQEADVAAGGDGTLLCHSRDAIIGYKSFFKSDFPSPEVGGRVVAERKSACADLFFLASKIDVPRIK